MPVEAVVHGYNQRLVTDICVQADKAAGIVQTPAGLYGIFNKIPKYQTQVIVENRIIAFWDIKLCLKHYGFICADGSIMGYNGIDSLVFTVFFRYMRYTVDQ